MSILDWFRPAKRPEPLRLPPFPARLVVRGDEEYQFTIQLNADGTAEYDRDKLRAWMANAKSAGDATSQALLWLLFRELERQEAHNG